MTVRSNQGRKRPTLAALVSKRSRLEGATALLQQALS